MPRAAYRRMTPENSFEFDRTHVGELDVCVV
jgi:hypothetical protein